MDKDTLEKAIKEGMVVLPSVPMGWECPKCGAVMNPNREVCVNCTGKPQAIAYTSIINELDETGVNGTKANPNNKYKATY